MDTTALTRFLATLRSAPAPLTRRERLAAWLLAIAVAVTRWPAVSLTLWDWDEALFALGVRHYDVFLHHPHPPGFPLFIGAAKVLVHLFRLDAFRAVQTVTVTASLFVFPAMFFLARELRLRTFTAFAAALLLAFFPNVWLFGGTGFSDVPSLVLAVVACALLLRGGRSDLAFLAGAVVLGIAAGVRPQSLLIGAAPFLAGAAGSLRTGRLTRAAGVIVTAAAIIMAIVIASYATAAMESYGFAAYRDTLIRHERYIRTTDSFLAPRHPGLIAVFDDFFLRPYRAWPLNIAISLLAFLGLVRRRPYLTVATFGPFLLFAWLFLDFHSASRFSIAYMPLFAICAAEGIPEHWRRLTLGAVIALAIVWTWPALRIVHTTPSPPAAAIATLPGLAGPTTPIYLDTRLLAQADYLFGHGTLMFNIDPRVHRVTIAPALRVPKGALLIREGASIAPGARNFTRERGHLEGIVRVRYFEVAVIRE
jgi:hypothetical protein